VAREEEARALLEQERQHCDALRQAYQKRRLEASHAQSWSVSEHLMEQRFVESLAAQLEQAEGEQRCRHDEYEHARSRTRQAVEAVRAAEASLRAVKSHKEIWQKARRRQAELRAEEELGDQSAARRAGKVAEGAPVDADEREDEK
jgi:hypothetical protein